MPAGGATPLGLGHTRISWLLVARAPNLGQVSTAKGLSREAVGHLAPLREEVHSHPEGAGGTWGPRMLCSQNAHQHPCLLRSCSPAAPAGEKLSHQLSNVTSGPVLKVLPGDARRPHTGPRSARASLWLGQEKGHRSRSRPQKAAQVSRAPRRVSGRQQEAPCSPGGRCGPGLAGPCLLHGEPGSWGRRRPPPPSPSQGPARGAPEARCGEPCSQREKYRVGRLLGYSTSAKALPWVLWF